MNCCSAFCTATQIQFGARVAARDLARYLRKGPQTTTRILRDLLATQAAGGTLLDIGAGIGVLPLELLSRGFGRATAVDASSAYVAAGRRETERRGLTRAIDWVEGDFVSLVTQVVPADVVTLDRVVCCYPTYEPLLLAALDRARQMVGLSYPRDRWYVRAAIAIENGLRWLQGDAFRVVVHPPARMAALMETSGFRLTGRRTTLAWSVEVYSKGNARGGAPGRGTSPTCAGA